VILKINIMKKILLVLALFFSLGMFSQNREESQWEINPNNEMVLNYQMLTQSYAQGLWQGSFGYATGMYLSGGRQGWGIVGSVLAVNVPILFNNNYDKPEIWLGKNLGVLTVSVTFSFVITTKRGGNMDFQLQRIYRKF
jgi:hypothetical protein